MSLGFVKIARNGGGSGGAVKRPTFKRSGGGGGGSISRVYGSYGQTPVSPRARPAPRTVVTARPVTVAPRGDFVSHYDPSRVIDLDKLKLVKDLRAPREFAAERGETVDPDAGITGPGSKSGAFAVPPRIAAEAPTTPQIGGQGLLIAAILAALVLGG